MTELYGLYEDKDKVVKEEDAFVIRGSHIFHGKVDINILALGDVGATLAMGLRLMGADVLNSIGLCDLNENLAKRYEIELNQVAYPLAEDELPKVKAVEMENLFDCRILVFCASTSIPPVTEKGVDVRMVQLESNSKIIRNICEKAIQHGFEGDIFVMSDPVDLLCKQALLAGIEADKIRGFGLGVMNARARYYSQADERFSAFPEKGRVFGPHGEGLIVANSIFHYDDQLSRELSELTINANHRVRDLGYKPYIGPALSSGAISILETIRGNWQYTSIYFGKGKDGAFWGCKNKQLEYGKIVENFKLDQKLYSRIKESYNQLANIL